MSIYIKRQLIVSASTATNYNNPVVSRGASEDQIRAQTHLAEAIAGPIVVPDLTTDLQLSMGPGITTGRAFYLETDQDITVKFNGTEADRALTIKPPTTAIVGAMYLDIEFTAVYVSNASGESANVYYAIIGA